MGYCNFLSALQKSKYLNKLYNLRSYSCSPYNAKMKGLILGVYTEPSESCNEIAACTNTFNEVNAKCNGQLSEILKRTGPFYKSIKHKILWTPLLKEKIDDNINCISVVDLGTKEAKDDALECLDQKCENIRCAIAAGVKALRASSHFEDIYVDACDHPQSVAEAAALTLFTYDDLKKESSRKPKSNLHLYKCANIPQENVLLFEKGLLFAESQNFARILMETPANLMTPTIFASTVNDKYKNSTAKVIVREEEWIKSMEMGSFLSVAKGSDEKPKFLEIHYNGDPSSENCIALVGKGITFDSGGISLKGAAEMNKMRADMGGAACVSATIYAASKLNLKINIKGFIPLCENMPSGKANKPGDVVRAMNGKTIHIDDTDAEGRLILADALCYAHKFNPSAILDLATLTGAMMIALGSAATGVFSTDDHLWDRLQKAGYVTGDRVWRMPLFKHYTKHPTAIHLADVDNGDKRVGGSCVAAAFLREFVASDMKWLHLDIAGVMENKDEVPYLCSGMSGRPTRTLIQFVQDLAGSNV